MDALTFVGIKVSHGYMRGLCVLNMDHGFTWHKITWLVLVIFVIFGVRYGMIIAPQVRATAAQVANINNLQKVDISGSVGGCVPINIKGTA